MSDVSDLSDLRGELKELAKTVQKDLKELAETVQDGLLNRVSETQRIQNEVERNGDKIGRLLKSVEGNGNPPVNERTALLEYGQKEISNKCNNYDEHIKYLYRWIIALLVGIVSSLSGTIGVLIRD